MLEAAVVPAHPEIAEDRCRQARRQREHIPDDGQQCAEQGDEAQTDSEVPGGASPVAGRAGIVHEGIVEAGPTTSAPWSENAETESLRRSILAVMQTVSRTVSVIAERQLAMGQG